MHAFPGYVDGVADDDTPVALQNTIPAVSSMP
jgi:hypothetical protein